MAHLSSPSSSPSYLCISPPLSSFSPLPFHAYSTHFLPFCQFSLFYIYIFLYFFHSLSFHFTFLRLFLFSVHSHGTYFFPFYVFFFSLSLFCLSSLIFLVSSFLFLLFLLLFSFSIPRLLFTFLSW